MADVYQDGSTQYGSQSTSITPPEGGASTAYILKDISLTRPSTRILTKDEIGRPKKKVHRKDLVTGTATSVSVVQ
jgi:hypothetical protein